MALQAFTMFLSAALLFQVQLLMGGRLLPWFGGGAGVWSACLAFFQTALLAGYLYAHAIGAWPARRQVLVHAALLALSLALFSIAPDESWKPQPEDDPIVGVLTLLSVHVGLPFVVLSASTVLLQRWLDVERPWALYAASNAGALLGLLGYPFLAEPLWTRSQRTLAWTVGYVLFALLLAWCGLRRWRAGDFGVRADEAAADAPRITTRLLWVLLPACSSAAMLAVSARMTQTVPPTPFLWVLPLAIHLSTFVVAFAGPRWYPRRLVAALFVLSLWPVLNAMYITGVDTWPRVVDSLAGRLGALAAGLFLLCLLCHGELYRNRPQSSRLSSYYLCIALGGALGGMAVALVAPLVFEGHVELSVVLVLTLLVLAVSFTREGWGRTPARVTAALAVLLAAGLGLRLAALEGALREGVVDHRRNFYGTLAVYELNEDDPEWHRFSLVHGVIEHGHQFQRQEWRGLPTAYFTPSAGAGLALTQLRPDGPRHVGVVGLGVGTIAAYGREGDRFRFYEIDPNVVLAARGWFDYLARSRAQIEVVVGDARLSLEREEPQAFDLLILDAFTADVMPVHLLTREAFEVYLSHLAPGGVLAMNVTSRSLEFGPTLAAMAESLSLTALSVESPRGIDGKGSASSWVLMTDDQEFLANPRVRARARLMPDVGAPVWSDERAPILDLIEWD